jgi:hypothetical protein
MTSTPHITVEVDCVLFWFFAWRFSFLPKIWMSFQTTTPPITLPGSVCWPLPHSLIFQWIFLLISVSLFSNIPTLIIGHSNIHIIDSSTTMALNYISLSPSSYLILLNDYSIDVPLPIHNVSSNICACPIFSTCSFSCQHFNTPTIHWWMWVFTITNCPAYPFDYALIV